MTVSHVCNTFPFQRALNEYYRGLLADPAEFEAIPDRIEEISEIRRLEDAWNEYELSRIADDELPRSDAEFSAWYERLKLTHRQDVSYLFEYLEQEGDVRAIALYVCLEDQVDGHFDDVIALSQLGMRGKAKLVVADNYWDEMGRGDLEKVHTRMFAESANYLQCVLREKGIDLSSEIPYEALKNGNMLLMYGLRRRFIGRLIGAIGILEDTAPYRFSATVNGMRRCGLPDAVIRYHEAHIKFDANHGAEWLNEVVLPMVRQRPALMKEVCLGMLVRYRIALDYYASIDRRIKSLTSC